MKIYVVTNDHVVPSFRRACPTLIEAKVEARDHSGRTLQTALKNGYLIEVVDYGKITVDTLVRLHDGLPAREVSRRQVLPRL